METLDYEKKKRAKHLRPSCLLSEAVTQARQTHTIFQIYKAGIFNVMSCYFGSILFHYHYYHENPAGAKSFKFVTAVLVSGGRRQYSAQRFTYMLVLFGFREPTYLILQPTLFP